MATRPPGFRQDGRVRRSAVERAELVVHGDPERLEDAADRVVGLPVGRRANRAKAARTTAASARVVVERRARVGAQDRGRRARRRGARRRSRRGAGPARPRSASESRADAGWPRAGFIRMSSGPSSLNVKPRAGSSICIEERPRSARISVRAAGRLGGEERRQRPRSSSAARRAPRREAEAAAAPRSGAARSGRRRRR